jgi:hypothetical protein
LGSLMECTLWAILKWNVDVKQIFKES